MLESAAASHRCREVNVEAELILGNDVAARIDLGDERRRRRRRRRERHGRHDRGRRGVGRQRCAIERHDILAPGIERIERREDDGAVTDRVLSGDRDRRSRPFDLTATRSTRCQSSGVFTERSTARRSEEDSDETCTTCAPPPEAPVETRATCGGVLAAERWQAVTGSSTAGTTNQAQIARITRITRVSHVDYGRATVTRFSAPPARDNASTAARRADPSARCPSSTRRSRTARRRSRSSPAR